MTAPGRLARHRALVAAVSVGVLAAVLIAVLASRSVSPGTVESSALGGKPAPPISGTDIRTGKAVSLQSLRGRYVVVNFFASWCGPCATETRPLVAFLFAHRHADNVAVLGVTFSDSAANARAFLNSTGASWAAVADPNGAIAVRYGVENPPESFVVAPDGKVIGAIFGGVTATALDTLRAGGRDRCDVSGLDTSAFDGRDRPAPDGSEPDVTDLLRGIDDARPTTSTNPSRVGRVLASRTSFVILIVLVGATLGIGSIHHAPQTPADRIAYLESIIKCPSCSDLSIAQSNEATAVGLRTVVATMVHAGRSDAAIEAQVQQLYPDEGEILVPNGGLTTLEWAIPLAALLVAAAVLLVALVRRRAPSGRASAEDEALVAAARRGSGG